MPACTLVFLPLILSLSSSQSVVSDLRIERRSLQSEIPFFAKYHILQLVDLSVYCPWSTTMQGTHFSQLSCRIFFQLDSRISVRILDQTIFSFFCLLGQIKIWDPLRVYLCNSYQLLIPPQENYILIFATYLGFISSSARGGWWPNFFIFIRFSVNPTIYLSVCLTTLFPPPIKLCDYW